MALNRYNFGITDDGQPYAVRPGRHVVRMLRGGKNRYAPNCPRRTTGSTRKQHRNKR
jgi:hypothetical protein